MSRNLLHLALITGPLALAACAGGADDTTDDTDTDVVETDDTETEQPETASVRVVHASPNAPAISLWSDGTEVDGSLAYGEATGFVDVPAGTFVVDLCGPDVADCDEPLGSVEFEIEADATYTFVAAGDFTSTAAADGFRIVVAEHGFGAPEAGSSLVRVVHASPDAPTVGIDVGADDTEDPEIPSFPRWAESGAAGIAFPADVGVRLGITPEDGGELLTSFSAPALGDGNEWFVIATGFAADKSYWDSGFALLAVNQDSETVLIRQDPRLVVLHGSQDAPVVDVFAGDAEVIGDLSYGETASLRVPPGSYDLDLFAANVESTTRPDGEPAFSVADLELEAGQEYLAVASGYFYASVAADTMFDVFVYPIAFSADDLGDAQVVLAHHSPDTGSVDVGPYDSSTCTIDAVAEDLEYGNGSDVLVLAEGDYDLGVAFAGEESAQGWFADLSLAAGQQVVAVVHGYSYFGPIVKAASVPSLSLAVTTIDTSGVLAMPWTTGVTYVAYPSCDVVVAF